MTITRRSFVSSLGLAGGGLLLSSTGCGIALRLPSPWNGGGGVDAVSPINRSLGDGKQNALSGDSFDWPHAIIRDGQLPNGKVVRDPKLYNVVIVGGGMAGMVSAWELRDYQPMVLEQAPRLGGNSKGESWRGTDYSIGAAYITKPDEDGEIQRFLQEVGAYDLLTATHESAPVAVDGTITPNLWDDYGDAKFKRVAATLKQYFLDVYNEENGQRFPEIPTTDSVNQKTVRELDGKSFHEHLVNIAGEPLPAELFNLIEHYCWSSFGASSTELSAAAGVNFYSCEFDSVLVGSGGNSAIIESILKKMPPDQFRVRELVVAIETDGNEVLVRAAQQDGSIKEYRAKTVVVAAPKFVAKRILPGLEPQRIEAINSLKYRGYLVANVLLDAKNRSSFYDMYFSSQAPAPANIFEATQIQNITDVVLANFADTDGSGVVLSLYRAYPFEGGRGVLYGMNTAADALPFFEQQINEQILPLLDYSKKDIHDIRFSRWGHALPVAAKGIYQAGIPEKLSAPFRERVFFAEQDNWALPCFETASTEAFRAAASIRKLLG